MGFCPSQIDDRVGRNTPKLTIWGDYYNQDTRALLAICDMAEIPHEFKLVDSLQNENKSDGYKKENPTQSIPMLTDNQWRILGAGGETTYTFLIENYHVVKKKFFNPQQEARINDMFRYFNQVVRKTTSRLVNSIVNKKVFSSRQQIDMQKIDQCLADFNEIMLRYESQLKK